MTVSPITSKQKVDFDFTTKNPDYTLVKTILGSDFVSPEEIMTARPGIIYTDEQIAFLAGTISAEDVFRELKAEGRALMPEPPEALALLDVRTLDPALFYSKTGGWYAEASQKFASEDKTSFGWLMARKTPVPDSTNRTWSEQCKLLSNVEYVPNAAEMGWFVTTFFKVRGVRLFENVYVRTSSVDASDNRVDLGDFVAEGLDVDSYWGNGRDSIIGVSSARKN
jgi:hypothetical protein